MWIQTMSKRNSSAFSRVVYGNRKFFMESDRKKTDLRATVGVHKSEHKRVCKMYIYIYYFHSDQTTFIRITFF